MEIRVNRLLSELNIGFQTLNDWLKALGYKEEILSINTKIPDSIAEVIREICDNDLDFLTIIEKTAKKYTLENQLDSAFPLKVVGRIDLDELNNSHSIKGQQGNGKNVSDAFTSSPIQYSDKPNFWIDDLMVLSPNGKASRICIGTLGGGDNIPLYSVLIGINGIGKSTLMKEMIDFFIDLHSCVKESSSKQSLSKTGQLRGIKYHIDGIECEVIRFTKTFLAKIDGNICALTDLRLPSIVACHFGTFDKLPTQKVNGTAQTKYDVPYYKYVGAHVNGSMISSSAIAFRLLFALNERMDERQRENICSILDFIGYDHKVSLSYTFVMRAKKDGSVLETIKERVDKDRDYRNLNKQEKNGKANQLYNFYKIKTSTGDSRHGYDIDFDCSASNGSDEELQYIYKLKQCDLIKSTNVLFHKHGVEITSDDMSSGEFAMLSTVLSISAAASDPHTLILLDEPELSLHPNWQMTLIDNLDRALRNRICHLLIATHSHMVVSDLPMKRSSVTQLEKDEDGNLKGTTISECTYGWSAEEVLLKVFKTATDRNRYFAERIGKLLEQMGNNSIKPDDVAGELKELQEISMHLSDMDPMKTVLNTIVEAYK